MNLTRLLVRIGNIACALVIAAIVFIIALAAGVVVVAWFVNQGTPAPAHSPVRPTHVRHYVLPLAGFATGVWLLWRYALSAASRAAQALASTGSVRAAARQTGFAIVWVVVAASAFAFAGWIQRKLYGFFLPP